ncbi:MAG: DUF4340 domain-containing protein [Bacteroidota bacterium]
MNNKVLLIILVALLAIFGLSKFFSGNDDSSFNPEFIKVDKEAVTKVVLHSKADNQEEVTLNKTEDGWTLSKNGNTYPAATEAVDNLLVQLASVKTNYIAAKNADKWTEYELNADQASQITVYGGSNILADFYIGKFSVNQQAQQITSFFRVADKDDVYAVIGMAGMMLGQGSNSYRNKKLLSLNFSDIESLNFEGDKVYQVSKTTEGQWISDNNIAVDTSKAKNYIMNLLSMSGETFVDFDENLNNDKLLKKLTITGSNMEEPVLVRCWRDDAAEKPFIIQSSQYPQSYFSSDSTRLFTRLFKGIEEW